MADPAFVADPIGFWDRRHAALDAWRSGGDRGLTPEENYEFYAYRLGRLIGLLRRHAGPGRGHRVLDAGCGRGHLADGLRRCGHVVVGVDSSPTAIGWARETYGGDFEVDRIDAHRPRALYDVVLCVDVLFHILDDASWAAALAAFGRYATAEGTLILTDAFPEVGFQVQDYIVHRAAARYDEALGALDFVRVEVEPYAFGSNPNQFAAYRRRA